MRSVRAAVVLGAGLGAAVGVFAGDSSLMELARCHLCESQPLAGPIEDCCQECDAATVERANSVHYLPILDNLTRTAALRYFQVDLWRECKLWADDGTCSRESCAVCECPPESLPPALQGGVASVSGAGAAAGVSGGKGCGHSDEPIGDGGGVEGTAGEEDLNGWAAEAARMSRVRLGGGPGAGEGLAGWALPVGEEEALQWTVADAASSSLVYVDMLSNPEGFTGYSGPSSHRIWSSIYDENCFRGQDGEDEGLCLEERAFFRLVSGLHASISTHLSRDALQGLPHHRLWVERVGRWPHRLRNLYFAYLVVLRAVHKAAPRLLAPGALSSGDAAQDAVTSRLLEQLLSRAASREVLQVASAFDESAMFRVRREDVLQACPAVLSGGLADMRELTARYKEAEARKHELLSQFRGKFRNISRIMDCVGCEKCRLWGKLQFLGLGTAMKVLFDEADGAEAVALTRNEAVALINVLHRLSISVAEVSLMRDREAAEALWRAGTGGALLLAVGGALMAGLCVCWRRQQRDEVARAVRRSAVHAEMEAEVKPKNE